MQRTIPQIKIDENECHSSDDEDWHSCGSSNSILEKSDIRAFRASWKGTVGKLVIYSAGVRFVRSLAKKELWKYTFLELAEMRKTDGSIAKVTGIARGQLEFKCTDGATLHIRGMKERDEAFNSIIGFSGLQWQSLQAEPGKKGDGSMSSK